MEKLNGFQKVTLKEEALEALSKSTNVDRHNGAHGERYSLEALLALKKMAENDVWPDWHFGDTDVEVWSLFHRYEES